jgi:beta-mannosidase
VSYGWDWHPRLVPSGIWDDTYLEIKNTVRFKHVDYTYQLDSLLENVQISIGGAVTGDFNNIHIRAEYDHHIVLDEICPAGNNSFSFLSVLKNIKLWWPYELGDPNMYEFHVELIGHDGLVRDSRTWKWGFRKVRLVMNKGGWENPFQWPKPRSNAPMTLEINNVRVFAKGTNWVNPEVFPGSITGKRYEELLTLARDMNFTLLRAWGGAIVNKDYFFEWCDEHGMMVWQDFPLACNDYPDDPAYLVILKQEATSIIRRLRQHPSLVIWCGGNELFNSWSGMTDQSLAIRWLNSLCLQYSPEIPFIPTSPVTGVGHGQYIFYDSHSDLDVFQLNNKATNTALPEFGMPSPSDIDILRTIIPENELFPPSPTIAWTAHHAYRAWVGQTWLCQDIIEKYFGKAESLEQLVSWGQKLQGIGYKAIYEHARQRWPECSMALNWCFNEPWPTAANNSIIQYPAQPKPCAESIRQACRPALASARIPKFSWSKDEDLTITLYLINGTQALIPGGEMEMLINGQKAYTWKYTAVAANENLAGPQVSFPLRDIQGEWILIDLHLPDHPELDSQYELHLKRES